MTSPVRPTRKKSGKVVEVERVRANGMGDRRYYLYRVGRVDDGPLAVCGLSLLADAGMKITLKVGESRRVRIIIEEP